MSRSSSSRRPMSSSDALDQEIPGAFPDNSLASYSNSQSLSQAIYARRAEYTRPRKIRVKVGTWNVASFKGTEKDIGGWFVQGKGVEEALAGLGVNNSHDSHDPHDSHAKHTPNGAPLDKRESVPDQERRRDKKSSTIPKGDEGSVPGGDDIDLYAIGLQEVVDITSAAEALKPYTDPAVANKFKDAIEEALPKGYTLVAEQQLIGLLLLVY
ncbi:hypothetical protein LTS18_013814, partial [Coniosporium uncinatum]